MSIDAHDHDDAREYGSDQEPEGGPLNRWVQSAIRNPRKVYRAMFVVAGIFFLVTTLFPLYWLLMIALSDPEKVRTGVGLLPAGFDPGSFIQIFTVVPFHWYMLNSLLYAGVTTVIVIVVASLAGYVFGRLEFRGKRVMMMAVLITSFFPPAAFFIPLFRLFNAQVSFMGLKPPEIYATPGAVVIPLSGIFMPLSIFILTTFYSQIPDGLEDAARVEGTTRLGALFRVIMPLSAPGVATAGILTFISVYNEFFFSFLMTGSSPAEWAPIVQGLLSYQSQYGTRFDLIAAASIVGVLPVAILVVTAQEKIVSGLTSGALKE